jgi:hypothetical protein
MFSLFTSQKDKLNKELEKDYRNLYNRILDSHFPKDIENIFLITVASSSVFPDIYDRTLADENISNSDYKQDINYQALYQIFISYHLFTLSQMFKNSKDLSKQIRISDKKLLEIFDKVIDTKSIIQPMLNQALQKEVEYEGNTLEVFGFFFFQSLNIILNESKYDEIFDKLKPNVIKRMMIQTAITIYFGEYSKAVRKSLNLPEKVS